MDGFLFGQIQLVVINHAMIIEHIDLSHQFGIGNGAVWLDDGEETQSDQLAPHDMAAEHIFRSQNQTVDQAHHRILVFSRFRLLQLRHQHG